MPQYLVAGYLPDDFDPSQADEATGREIHALNKEMIAAGVRKFACGLGSAKSLRAQTDGGHTEARQHDAFAQAKRPDVKKDEPWAAGPPAGCSVGEGRVRPQQMGSNSQHGTPPVNRIIEG